MLYVVCWKKLNVYALSWYTRKLCICKQCEEMVVITAIPLCINFPTQNSSTPLHPQTEAPPDGTPGTVRKRKRKRVRKTELNRGEALQMEYHSQVCMTVTCSYVQVCSTISGGAGLTLFPVLRHFSPWWPIAGISYAFSYSNLSLCILPSISAMYIHCKQLAILPHLYPPSSRARSHTHNCLKITVTGNAILHCLSVSLV